MSAFLCAPALPARAAWRRPAPAPRRARVACAAEPRAPHARRSLLTSHVPVLPVLVRVARASWYRFWRLLMSELAPSDAEGRYVRPSSSLADAAAAAAAADDDAVARVSALVTRDFVERDAPYALYVGLACQWCHRVMLARALLHLDAAVELRYLQPGVDGLWVLEKPEWKGAHLLKHIYLDLDPKYHGRFTAPLLVHVHADQIVSNESAHILAWFAQTGRVALSPGVDVWLRPDAHNDAGVDVNLLDDLCKMLYHSVNDGVYRCGFATSQMAYEEAQQNLFSALDRVEALLSNSRFLCSPTVVTEADVRLFPTVFRFDAVYAILFKASRKSIRADYPAISAWIRDMYNLPGVAETCDIDATRTNYYTSLFPLNPSAIVPIPPPQDLSPAPERRGLGLQKPAAV